MGKLLGLIKVKTVFVFLFSCFAVSYIVWYLFFFNVFSVSSVLVEKLESRVSNGVYYGCDNSIITKNKSFYFFEYIGTGLSVSWDYYDSCLFDYIKYENNNIEYRISEKETKEEYSKNEVDEMALRLIEKGIAELDKESGAFLKRKDNYSTW